MESPKMKRLDYQHPEYDKPNVVYRMVGKYIAMFADIGATDKELKQLFKKGPDTTLLDLAKLEEAHTHYREVQE